MPVLYDSPHQEEALHVDRRDLAGRRQPSEGQDRSVSLTDETPTVMGRQFVYTDGQTVRIFTRADNTASHVESVLLVVCTHMSC
jgi:hypothetical protein